MEEERAYVEWLKGQQNVKDTKPAMEMVSWKQYLKCAVPENNYTHPMGGHWKFQGDGRSQKPKFLQKVWGLTGISKGVGGFKPKNLPWEGYGYFLEQLTMCLNVTSSSSHVHLHAFYSQQFLLLLLLQLLPNSSTQPCFSLSQQFFSSSLRSSSHPSTFWCPP